MNNSTKTVLSVLLISTLTAGGISTLALADSPQRSNNTSIAQAVEEDEELEEQQEAARLQPLAKISAEQAKEAALQVQSGEVKELELEAEDGSLVYEVTIGETEVFVDAGNGEVLYTQGINEEVDEATKAARPRSSIQVAEEEK